MKLNATKIAEIKKAYAENAKREDLRGDAQMRNHWAWQWRQLATKAEIRRAPKYLQDWR
jgi:hypothetical protein